MFEYASKLLQKLVEETQYPIQMSFSTNRVSYSIDILHLAEHDIKICFYNSPNNAVEIHLVEKKHNKSLYLYLYKASIKNKDLPDVDILCNRLITFAIDYDSFKGEKTNDTLIYMWDNGKLPPLPNKLINKEGLYRLYFKDCTDTLAIVYVNEQDGKYYYAPINFKIEYSKLRWDNNWANVIDYETLGVKECQ